MDDGFAMGYALGQDSGGNRNSGGMFDGNGSWIWIIVVFALLFGWGNNGNGNGQGANNGSGGGYGMPAFVPYPVGGAALQGAVTRSDLCSEFNFNGLENSVRGIQQGICDSTFALNNTITGGNNATQMAMMQGFNGVGNAVCDLGYNIQQGFNTTQVAMMQGQNALQTQLADCCCRTNNNIERGFADVGYRMATDACAIQTSMANSTRDIIDSQQAGTRAILDYLTQQEAANLRAENQSLKLAASQAAQNSYLVNTLRPSPIPAYPSCNPWSGCGGNWQGCNCGGNGCC